MLTEREKWLIDNGWCEHYQLPKKIWVIDVDPTNLPDPHWLLTPAPPEVE